MNTYEMEGFLRGQCVPRDLIVNESNAAYLVRKLGEISSVKAERDALERQLSMLEAKCKGYFSDAAAALVKCDALAVESASMREALDSIRIYSSDTLSGPSDSVPDMAAWLREGVEHLHQVSTIETPATSAALAAIQARAKAEAFAEIIEFIDRHSGLAEMKTQWDLSSAIVAHIAELREAK
ncbi:TPA: hypothetical protein ACGD77_002979 [Serratia marcescens]